MDATKLQQKPKVKSISLEKKIEIMKMAIEANRNQNIPEIFDSKKVASDYKVMIDAITD